ncbi:MAG: DUF4870 domain-containing protein [Cyanobacteria bacterium P01_D01_bin.6]
MNDSSLTLYQQGAAAFKQARYPEAIAQLEQFCKETSHRQSKPFLKAQMLLVQAYHKDHKDLHAISLCEQLIKSDVTQVQQWATQALNKLMTPTSPSPAAPSDLAAAPGRPPATAQNPFDVVADTPHTAAGAPPPFSVEDGNPFDQQTDVSPLSPATPSSPSDQTADMVTSTAAANAITSRAATPPVQRSSTRPRAAKQSPPKDLTQQIMSAIAHGSISMLASIVLYLLFSDSIMANGLGILRFAVPLLIFFTTQDTLVKDNAREALNYTITCLLLFIPLIFAAIALALILAVMPPIGLLLGLILGGYLLTFSIYPVVGTIICLTQEDRVFEYPNWLILHLL